MSTQAGPPAPEAAVPQPSPAGLLVLTLQALRFYSRLPLPTLAAETQPHGPPDFERLPLALPLAGLLLGAVPALVLLALMAIGIPALPASAIALAAQAVSTGFFHEDALADAADGLWGGITVERRLAIMRDSRVGAFGAATLAFGILIRVSLLAALASAAGPGFAAVVLLGLGAVSRVAGLMPLALLPPVRPDGFAALVRLRGRVVAVSVAGAALALLVPLAARLWFAGAAAPSALSAFVHAALLPTLLGFGGAALGAFAVTRLSANKIGGQTGDIAGAAQQAAEMGCFLALVALAHQA